MGVYDNVIIQVKKMSETEAKKVLAEIFMIMRTVGMGGYTSDMCYNDIQKVYKKKIAFKQM